MIITEATRSFDYLSAEIRALAERLGSAVVLVRNGNGDGGSGVRWDRDLVISNHHVVHHGTCQVVFHDGYETTARVIARDPKNDLVALRIEGDAPDLEHPVTVDFSRTSRVGELVVAIGHPIGAEWAVTTGIVSRVPAEDDQRRLLRASVTLLPGNSGGALVNIDGDLIGINAMLSGPAEALAIPSDIVDAFARMAASTDRATQLT